MFDWRDRYLSDYSELEQDAVIRCIDPLGDQKQASKDLNLIKKEKNRIRRYKTKALYLKFIAKEYIRREKLAQLFYNLEQKKFLVKGGGDSAYNIT